MSRSVVCYPQPGKPKSRHILEAFAQGCGGRLAETYQEGPAAFYGVVGIEALWRKARAGSFYYLDNSYFDNTRWRHFRVGVNALQASGTERPDWSRYMRLGVLVEPWRRGGRHVVVVEQSEHFMREVAEWPIEAWRAHVRREIAANTDRPVVVRPWSRDKAGRMKTLHEDLKDAWVLVTHSSSAANEAVLAGVPVICTGPCAARVMGTDDFTKIESPHRALNRIDWAAALAGQQWTIDELRDGTAWKHLAAG